MHRTSITERNVTAERFTPNPSIKLREREIERQPREKIQREKCGLRVPSASPEERSHDRR